MGGIGVQGPQEHVGLFKLCSGENAPTQFGQGAGKLLTTIASGIAGASFRPVTSADGYEWVFKIQFKSVEDVETFYGMIEDLDVAGDLIESSIMVDVAGIRGGIKPGTGEILALFNIPESMRDAMDEIEGRVEDASPPGMTKISIRPIHEADALFSGYPSLQPGYTHALMVDFDTEANLQTFLESGVLASSMAVIPEGTEPKGLYVSYVF
jgi:hypothetical protein